MPGPSRVRPGLPAYARLPQKQPRVLGRGARGEGAAAAVSHHGTLHCDVGTAVEVNTDHTVQDLAVNTAESDRNVTETDRNVKAHTVQDLAVNDAGDGSGLHTDTHTRAPPAVMHERISQLHLASGGQVTRLETRLHA